MKKANLVKTILVLALSMSLFAGCGADSGNSAAAGNNNVQNQGETNEMADTNCLTVAINTEPTSLDLQSTAISAAGTQVGTFIYDTLVWWNSDTMSVEPMLATEWERIDDYTVQFKLRDDVISHNGCQLTSADVKATFERGATTSALKAYYGFFDIDNFELVDDYTINIRTFEPYPDLLNVLTLSCYSIASEEGIELNGGLEAFARKPEAGTGKYKFVEWTSGDSIKLVRNDEYWGEKGAFDEVIIKIIPDATTRLLALQSGDVDAINKVMPSSAAEVEADENLTLIQTDNAFQMYCIYMNEQNIPDENVRRAMSLAIDKNAVLQLINAGYGEVSDGGPFPTCMEAYQKGSGENYSAYDVETAKSLIEKANAAGTEINILCMENQSYSDIGEFAQNAWGQIGLNAHVTVEDKGKFFEDLYAGNYDCYIITNSNMVMLKRTFEVADSRLDFSSGGSCGVTDGSWDDLIDQCNSVIDETARAEVLSQLEDKWRMEVPVICLFNSSILDACKASVTGISVAPMGDPVFVNMKPVE